MSLATMMVPVLRLEVQAYPERRGQGQAGGHGILAQDLQVLLITRSSFKLFACRLQETGLHGLVEIHLHDLSSHREAATQKPVSSSLLEGLLRNVRHVPQGYRNPERSSVMPI